MSPTRTHEEKLLASVERMLVDAVSGFTSKETYGARLSVLEGAAARLGGFSVRAYQEAFAVDPLFHAKDLEKAGAVIARALTDCGMHPALALSALAREPIDRHAQRSTGAHHTDFRLATMLGRKAAELNPDRRAILDPACGAGILLVATTLATLGSDRTGTADWLRSNVHASDVSDAALRGTRLALSSLTEDLDAIASMNHRFSVGDSLLREHDDWQRPSNGFGVVVANPPWEKVKIHRHERLRAAGHERHYGQAYAGQPELDLQSDRSATKSYASKLAERFPSIARGEVDLYGAFTELMIRLAGEDGSLVAFLPAGLIRSQGTQGLREEMLKGAQTVDLTILDNKARFFSIDTRFKFVLAAVTRNPAARTPKLLLRGGEADATQARSCDPITMSVKSLRALRPDLTIPEVRSSKEWRLFQRLSSKGVAWDDDSSSWQPNFCREADMTKERPHFVTKARKGSLPVIEGRMVQHHRFGAKTYVSGEGRRADWRSNPIGSSRVEPQFWMPEAGMSRDVRARTRIQRVGFCDIAGQTNERSMTSTIIPAGVICGNKVPTVLFVDDADGDKARLWCGLVNSFVFDWMLRRVLTTTVNYFLVRSVPLPPIQPGSLPGRRIVEAVKALEAIDRSGETDAAWATAEQKAIIDAACFRAFGLGELDIATILDDFPLLDRSQPALPGEARSLVTRDFLGSKCGGNLGSNARRRLALHRSIGAIPYVPSQNGENETDNVKSSGAETASFSRS